MSREIDYLLRVVVPDIDAYDRFYKRLIDRVDLCRPEFQFRHGANKVNDHPAPRLRRNLKRHRPAPRRGHP
ncbi:MAG: Lrp/AsnC ligand binding domain-containing protein [Rhodospirillales bacterium]|nr:Lrp/AsnC ligand binding domain-containing protein [Rhodospirillales bacterium]